MDRASRTNASVRHSTNEVRRNGSSERLGSVPESSSVHPVRESSIPNAVQFDGRPYVKADGNSSSDQADTVCPTRLRYTRRDPGLQSLTSERAQELCALRIWWLPGGHLSPPTGQSDPTAVLILFSSLVLDAFAFQSRPQDQTRTGAEPMIPPKRQHSKTIASKTSLFDVHCHCCFATAGRNRWLF